MFGCGAYSAGGGWVRAAFLPARVAVRGRVGRSAAAGGRTSLWSSTGGRPGKKCRCWRQNFPLVVEWRPPREEGPLRGRKLPPRPLAVAEREEVTPYGGTTLPVPTQPA